MASAPSTAHQKPDTWEVSIRPLRWAQKQLYFRSDFDKVIEEYNKIKSKPDQLQKFVGERKKETKEIIDVGLVDGISIRNVLTRS